VLNIKPQPLYPSLCVGLSREEARASLILSMAHTLFLKFKKKKLYIVSNEKVL